MSLPQPPRKQGIAQIIFLLIATSVQARFLEARTKPARQPGKKRQSLLAQRTSDPGFFKNFGVRGGAPQEDMGEYGDDGSKHDSTLDHNVWFGDSMNYDFPFLDNMKPVAPMDRLSSGDGAYGMDAHYISEYINPDAFPVVHGSGCMCKSATKPGEKIECNCGNHSDNDHYTWLKDTPVHGTNNFTLTPADITYRAGNYWSPQHEDGLVAPADRMPIDQYPNQAPPNHVWPLPVSAHGDRIRIKYTRYIDQVHAKAEECGPNEKDCTVPCKPGDSVVMALGNTRVNNVKVIKSFVGNAVQVELVPSAAATAKETTSCKLQDACTTFRFCKGDSHCVVQKEIDSHSWTSALVRKNECPEGTKVCKTVNQVVMANILQKDGKYCRATAR